MPSQNLKWSEDLLALLEHTNGFTINAVTVNGFGQFEDVAMEDAKYPPEIYFCRR